MGGCFGRLRMYALSLLGHCRQPPLCSSSYPSSPPLPPFKFQAAILAVGTTQQRVVMSGGKLAAETFMTVSLSADHRVYDGELAAALLNAFKGKIENPSRMLLS